jgi:hypothetical protein
MYLRHTKLLASPGQKIMNLPRVPTRGLALLEENLSDVIMILKKYFWAKIYNSVL